MRPGVGDIIWSTDMCSLMCKVGGIVTLVVGLPLHGLRVALPYMHVAQMGTGHDANRLGMIP